MYTPFKMKGKSPMMKALIGGQKNLAKQGAPELQAAIEGAPVKKKTEAQKLNKLVDKRTKLRNKKTKRTELEKNTKRVDRKLEKNQTKINANSQAQKNFNDAKRVSGVKGGAKKALQSKESSVKMMKNSPTKLTGKERRAAIEKAKSGTYDNAKAKRKAVLEARKKANKAFAEAKVKKVKKAVSNVNEKIQTGAKNLSDKLKSKKKIVVKKELTNQQKINAKNPGGGYSNATSVNALVKVRNRWRKENPGKKFPGQSEINKRLKANPNKFD